MTLVILIVLSSVLVAGALVRRPPACTRRSRHDRAVARTAARHPRRPPRRADGAPPAPTRAPSAPPAAGRAARRRPRRAEVEAEAGPEPEPLPELHARSSPASVTVWARPGPCQLVPLPHVHRRRHVGRPGGGADRRRPGGRDLARAGRAGQAEGHPTRPTRCGSDAGAEESQSSKPPRRRRGRGPRVTLVVGVNGVGKTTSIGKLAAAPGGRRAGRPRRRRHLSRRRHRAARPLGGAAGGRGDPPGGGLGPRGGRLRRRPGRPARAPTWSSSTPPAASTPRTT